MKRISISPPVAALILAVVLFLLSGLLPNGYGSDVDVAIAQATNIVRLAVFLGIIAAGQTLVIISGSEGIDLSAGSIVTLTAILTYVIVSGNNEMVLLALLVSFASWCADRFPKRCWDHVLKDFTICDDLWHGWGCDWCNHRHKPW